MILLSPFCVLLATIPTCAIDVSWNKFPFIIRTLILFYWQPPQSVLPFALSIDLSICPPHYFPTLCSFYHPSFFLLFTTHRLHYLFLLGRWVFDSRELLRKRWTILCGAGCVFTTGYSANIQDSVVDSMI